MDTPPPAAVGSTRTRVPSRALVRESAVRPRSRGNTTKHTHSFRGIREAHMSDQRIVRPTPISGFPEWSPQIRAVEQQWLDHIRAGFESFGFASIETPSVENLETLMAQGETSQEVYTLRRLQADGKDDSDARLGLHFGLTVPFARYVAQHSNHLTFPFKRYQMQRFWRGERPPVGRFRDFTPADIDVIDVDSVPLHFDAELPRSIHR